MEGIVSAEHSEVVDLENNTSHKLFISTGCILLRFSLKMQHGRSLSRHNTQSQFKKKNQIATEQWKQLSSHDSSKIKNKKLKGGAIAKQFLLKCFRSCSKKYK